ncbi:hypothetical protein ACOME3_008619 [Neoechinorhynchus agilis]
MHIINTASIIVFMIHLFSMTPVFNDFRFESPVYAINVTENTVYQQPLLNVSTNSRPGIDVRYEMDLLSQIETGDALDIFKINEKNGTLTVVNSHLIDFEKRKGYRLRLIALRSSSTPTYAFAELVINILDQNDNIPCIRLLSWNDGITTMLFDPTGREKQTQWYTDFSSQEFSLKENIDIEVAIFQISDMDSGINGETNLFVNDTRFELKLTERQPHFTIYTMRLTIPIDREIENCVPLKLTAVDHGTSVLWQDIEMKLNILDENDCGPEFNEAIKFVSVHENREINTPITQLLATDPDLTGGPIVYSLIGSCDFFIDRNQGTLYALKSFDREQRETYEINVSATDHENGMSANLLVKITIEDENDNPPLFSNQSYIFHLAPPKGELLNRVIGQVFIYDLDKGENAVIDLKIMVSAFAHCFGLTRTEKPLLYLKTNCINWNRRSDINLTLVAENRTPPYYRSNATVKIRVSKSKNEVPLPMLINITATDIVTFETKDWQSMWCEEIYTSAQIKPVIAWLYDENCSTNCKYRPSDLIEMDVDQNGMVYGHSLEALQKLASQGETTVFQISYKSHRRLKCKFGWKNEFKIYVDKSDIFLFALPPFFVFLTAIGACYTFCNRSSKHSNYYREDLEPQRTRLESSELSVCSNSTNADQSRAHSCTSVGMGNKAPILNAPTLGESKSVITVDEQSTDMLCRIYPKGHKCKELPSNAVTALFISKEWIV